LILVAGREPGFKSGLALASHGKSGFKSCLPLVLTSESDFVSAFPLVAGEDGTASLGSGFSAQVGSATAFFSASRDFDLSLEGRVDVSGDGGSGLPAGLSLVEDVLSLLEAGLSFVEDVLF